MIGKLLNLVTCLGLLLYSSYALAVENDERCTPSSYEQLVNCGLAGSLSSKISQQQLIAASELSGIARQWSNPELELESMHGGSDQSETSASLLFDIGLGGKRSASLLEAQAEADKVKAENGLNLAQTKLDLVLALNRLSQLSTEIQYEEETVLTFSKIIGQFQRKSGLSPEQNVSVSVFSMAISDHKLRLTKLKNEKFKILQNVTLMTDFTQETIMRFLPPLKKNWPQISNGEPAVPSLHLQLAESELKVNQGQYELAKANSWPDLKIGPAYKLGKDGNDTDHSFGLTLSLPLPFFSQNGAGRSYAEQKLKAGEMNLELTKRKAKSLRQQLVDKYQGTVSALKQTMSSQIVKDRHQEIERLFFKGMVSSSLVIEAHRQLIELEMAKNESTLEALEALGTIYIIDNKISEVVL